MRSLDFGRYVLAGFAVAAMLAGCGGSEPPIGAPSAMPQSRVHTASGSSGELIYVTTSKAVIMLSYPQGNNVGSIPWSTQFDRGYICSDPTSGNVFIPEGSGGSDSKIYEYAHGATSPMATLSLPAGYTEPTGCAVDPTTGNLAVNINYGPYNRGALLVYPGVQGAPVVYSDKQLTYFYYPAYDDSGNLFSTSHGKEGGIRIAEIPAGQNQFTLIKFTNCTCVPSKMQWDGSYLTFEDPGQSGNALFIDQLAISGTTATLINSIQLLGGATNNLYGFWIQDGSVFAMLKKILKKNNEGVGAWPYPSGGNRTSKFYGITKGEKDFVADLTVSINPSRSKSRQ